MYSTSTGELVGGGTFRAPRFLFATSGAAPPSRAGVFERNVQGLLQAFDLARGG